MDVQACDERLYGIMPDKSIRDVVENAYLEVLGIENQQINPELSFIGLGGMCC